MFFLRNWFITVFLVVTTNSFRLNAMEPRLEEEAKEPITLRALLIGPKLRPQIPWRRPFQERGHVPYEGDYSTPLNEQSEKMWQEIAQERKLSLEAPNELPSEVFLAELQKAEDKFIDSYVHMGNFLTKWPSALLEKSLEFRRQVMDELLSKGLVELYNTSSDGELAIRCTR